MKFLLFAAFVAVASAQYDDGSYRPEHHGGEYRHQNQPGKYYHGVIPIESVVSIVPKVIAQPLSQPLTQTVSVPQQLATPRFLAQPVSVSQQLATPRLIAQPLAHPVTVPQQFAAPRLIAQPLAHPVAVSQQLAHPVAVPQQLAHPVALSQQLATPRLIAQPLAQTVSVPQQVAVPRLIAPSFDVPQQITVAIPAARLNNDGQSQTLREYREQSSTGDYKFQYETDNGIHANEQSQALPPKSQSKTGFYEFTSPEGQHFRVDYVADENGFRASGAHLPVAPASA